MGRDALIFMRDLRIRFEGLDTTFPGLVDQAGFITNILQRKYNIIVLDSGDEEPDVLFYSWLGTYHTNWFKCIRIYITMEMDYPDFNMCDYAIGLVNIGIADRYIHLPLCVYYNNLLRKYENRSIRIDGKIALERDFCSLVLSNHDFRDPVFKVLYSRINEYKHITSGGKWNNNIGGPVNDKLDFIKNYKFNLAIENADVDGYVTEKIFEPFVAGCVPIYWGNRWVKREFGEGGYINIQDFDTLDNAINYIKKVDSDDELYLKMLAIGPKMLCDYNGWCDCLLDFLVKAIEHGKYLSDVGLYGIIHKEHFLVNTMRQKTPLGLFRKILKGYYGVSSYVKRLLH